jgi:hypothetical protein
MATNNDFKSTNIRGIFQNIDYPDGSVTADAYFQRNLKIDGDLTTSNINSTTNEIRIKSDVFIQRQDQTDDNRGVGIFSNNQDGSSFSVYNGGLFSYNSIGFKSTFNNLTKIIFQLRTGIIFCTQLNLNTIILAGENLINILLEYGKLAQSNIWTGLNTFNEIICSKITAPEIICTTLKLKNVDLALTLSDVIRQNQVVFVVEVVQVTDLITDYLLFGKNAANGFGEMFMINGDLIFLVGDNGDFQSYIFKVARQIIVDINFYNVVFNKKPKCAIAPTENDDLINLLFLETNYASLTDLNDSLTNYVLTTTLNNTLVNYTTVSALNNTLVNYTTVSALNNTLVNYTTTSELNNTLVNYTTVSALNNTLVNYTTVSALNNTLSNYVLTTTLNNTLVNYTTVSALNNTLVNYTTTSALNNTLSNYSTNTDLNNYVLKVQKETFINNKLLTANQGTLTLNHSDECIESSICFTSNSNANSDFGYIKYIDNYNAATYSTTSPTNPVQSTAEASRLIIGIENDASNNSIKDSIVLYAAGGLGYIGINKLDPNYALDINGDVLSNGNIECETLKSFSLDLNGGSINNVININFGTAGNYISLNPNNNFYSFYSKGGHAFYADNQGVVNFDNLGLHMSANKKIYANEIICDKITVGGNTEIKPRLIARIQNINNILTFTYESDNSIIQNYPNTNRKVKKNAVGVYSIAMDSSIILNNNYFLAITSSLNGSILSGTTGLCVVLNARDTVIFNGITYRVFSLSVTRNNNQVLTDLASNTDGYIEFMLSF